MQKQFKSKFMKCNNSFLKFLFFSLVYLLVSPVLMVAQQGITVSGKVADQGDPLPGVTVAIKGTSQGTATDINGAFTLSVPDANAVLVFSYIGYVTQEITVGSQRVINVSLMEDTQKLEEVVVIAYGVQKKESLVGAVSQVKGEELVRSGTGNVSQTLTGRIPGMVTMMQTGLPGDADPVIFVRGLASFTGNNQPLVMVDGIERQLSNIDPSEVETISVLKDASATAVYGVKGGNGVILITTKRGQEGRMEITVNTDATLKQSLTKTGQENSYTMLMARNQLFRNQQSWSRILDQTVIDRYRWRQGPWDEYLYPDIDHWDVMTKPFAWDTRASISARGGTKLTKYYLMMGYFNETDFYETVQTNFPATLSFKRVNFRMNFDFDFTESTKLSVSTSGYVGTRDETSLSATVGNLFRDIYLMPPHTPYMYPKEFVEAFPDPKFPDKVYDRVSIDPYWIGFETGYVKHNYTGLNRNVNNRLTTDIVFNQKLDFIAKGLALSASFSFNNYTRYGAQVWGNDYESWLFQFTEADASDYTWTRYVNNRIDDFTVLRPSFQRPVDRRGNNYDYVYGARLNYAHVFAGDHTVSALALFQRRFAQDASSFPLYEEQWSGRATYDYQGKYMLEGTLGVTGSARFAPNNRFGVFPSGAVGWNLSKERFIRNILPPLISNLKARYSYGVVGADNVSGYLYISEYTNWDPGQNQGSNNYGTYYGGFGDVQQLPAVVREGAVPNVNAQWERARKHNLGFDLGLFDNSFNFSAEFFSEYRDRILMSRRSISAIFGQSMREMNLGEVKRHGMELEMSYNRRIKDGMWWTSANYNFNENRVVKRDVPYATPIYLSDEGKPIGWNSSRYNTGKYYTNMDQYMNYLLGITAQKAFGRDITLDFDGNGLLDANDNIPISMNERPTVTYGWSGGLIYKQLEVNFLFQGQHNMYRNWDFFAQPMQYLGTEDRWVKWKGYGDDLWTPTNLNAPYGAYGEWANGQKSWREGAYFRLKQLEIAYRFEQAMLHKIGLKSARIALQGYNLWTYTKVDYFFGDPENEPSGHEGGWDALFHLYPIPRRYTIALKFDF